MVAFDELTEKAVIGKKQTDSFTNVNLTFNK